MRVLYENPDMKKSPNAFTCVHDKLNIGSSCLLGLLLFVSSLSWLLRNKAP